MIFDTLENCNMYYGLQENFKKAFDFIRKAESKCVFCNSLESLKEFQGKHICSSCLEKIKG